MGKAEKEPVVTQPRRWIDSLSTQELDVEVPVGLTVQVTGPLIWTKRDRPVACPWCHTTAGLTARTAVNDAIILCPQGHAWSDRVLQTAAVRQLYALHECGGIPSDEPLTIPHVVGGVWLWLLPGAHAPGVLGFPATPLPAAGIPRARPLHDLELRDPNHPLPWRSALLAGGLLAWALPHDGTLFDRLVLAPGGGRVAHTVGLALWQLLHDTAINGQLTTTAGEPRPGDPLVTLDVADLAARLNPDDTTTAPFREQLRTPAPEVMGLLTEADVTRLHECDAQEWADACALAHLALVVHLYKARIGQAYTAGYALESVFLRPRLLDCPAVIFEAAS
jgi:hypothetical protein